MPQEAMRVRPVAATGSTRYTKRDMVIGGHFLPKGSMVDVPFYAVSAHPSSTGRCKQSLPGSPLTAMLRGHAGKCNRCSWEGRPCVCGM